MDEISTRYHESTGRNPHEYPSRQVSARMPSPGCVGGPKIAVDDKRASRRDHRSVTNDVYVTSLMSHEPGGLTRPRPSDSPFAAAH